MIKTRSVIFFSLLLGILQITCREEYTPPATGENKKFLILEGFANSGQDSTVFTLSRTRKLVDTTTLIPELHASIIVESESGSSYPIAETGNGVYKSPAFAITVF
ncbi:MAG: hypothetical protein WDO19_32695 [Bacteroidota bacterium]